MPEFVDLEVRRPLPTPMAWPLIAPKVLQRHPKPPKPGTICESPESIAAAPVVLTPAELAFRMASVGYGAYAHYGVTWLLSGKPLTASEVVDLRRLTAARLSVVHRAYRMAPGMTAAGMPTVDLVQRSIYPLIESTERGSVSFVLGCAMAEVCAPNALNTRPGFTAAKLWHLFHVNLIQAASTCATVLKVDMTTRQKTDFVGIDSALGTLHIFEAKGSGDGFDGSRVSDGLSQCEAVEGIRVMGGALEQPASLNVCVSYLHGGRVCSAVYQLTGARSASSAPGSPTATPAPPNKSEVTSALDLLLGTKLMGTYLMLRGADVEQTVGRWTVFDIASQAGEGAEAIRVALPSALWIQLSDFWERAEQAMARVGEHVRLRHKLTTVSVTDAWPERRPVLENLLSGLGKSMLQLLETDLQQSRVRASEDELPEGFELSGVEPWLAFERALSAGT